MTASVSASLNGTPLSLSGVVAVRNRQEVVRRRDVSVQRSALPGPSGPAGPAPMVATGELRQPAGRIAQLLRDKAAAG